MPLVDHLAELRRRIIVCLLALMAGTGVAWFWVPELIDYLTRPVGILYFRHPGEVFFTYLKLSLVSGVVLGSPVIFYEIWAFVLPALTSRERRAALILTPVSILLFLAGTAFSYYLALPAGLKFFLGFASMSLQPLLSLADYLSFVLSFLLPFGLVFELPLVIVAAAMAGIATSARLAAARRTVIVVAFVLGLLLAPTPDIFSQTLIAVPILVLYELSILFVRQVLHR